MEKIPRITAVKALPNRHLEVLFFNGTKKDYDCRMVMDKPEFFMLRDEIFFNTVKVDTGGYGISWNDNVDLSEYELWTNGEEIQ